MNRELACVAGQLHDIPRIGTSLSQPSVWQEEAGPWSQQDGAYV